MSYHGEVGSLFLTATEVQMLYRAARIGELRNHYRIGDPAIYRLLQDISRAAFSDADDGNLTRQTTASEERSHWTVQQIAKKTGRAARTIRLDIETGLLPATKPGTTWIITNADAHTYIATWQPS
jgi:hypothetical protein